MFASRIRDLKRSDLTFENLEAVFKLVAPRLNEEQRGDLLAAVVNAPVNLAKAAAHLTTPVQMLALEEIVRTSGGAAFPDLKANPKYLKKRLPVWPKPKKVMVPPIPHADGFTKMHLAPKDAYSKVARGICRDWRGGMSLNVISLVHSTEETPISLQTAANIIRRGLREEAHKIRMNQGPITVIDLHDAGILKWRDVLEILRIHKANPKAEDIMKGVDFDYNFKGQTGIKSKSARKAFLQLPEILRKKGYAAAAMRFQSIPSSQGRFEF